MKTAFALALVLALVVPVAACSSSGGRPSQPAVASPAGAPAGYQTPQYQYPSTPSYPAGTSQPYGTPMAPAATMPMQPMPAPTRTPPRSAPKTTGSGGCGDGVGCG